MKRNPRFKVAFGCVCPMTADKVAFGMLSEQMFTFTDLSFFLRVLSPINSDSWISFVKNLPKGGNLNLTFDETTKDGIIKKVVKITR
jgi:hypothetical protein